MISSSPSSALQSSGSSYTQPSFSLANRLARLLWQIVYTLLYRPSPRPAHAWRAFLLRCFGAKLGRGCHFYPAATIWAPWNLEAEDEVAVANRAILYNQAPIRLGYRVVVSQGAHLCTGTHRFESPRFELVAYPITIQPQAWICAEAFIHPGVTVHEGAVIGARAVVTKDMPAWTVCAGHPCGPLKPRRISELPSGA